MEQFAFDAVLRAYFELGWRSVVTSVLVLLVEDEPLIRIDVESSLVEAGLDVVDAANGADAMRIFDERPADFSALITDIRLGQGPSGWDVARHVRGTVPTMPVVYISGDSAGDWSSQGVPNSVMIAKPFIFSQIITAISTLLNQPDQLSS